MKSADYFSATSEAYAAFRPTYPDDLIEHIASCAPGRALAWDCATGSGQAAVPLARWMARVVATDRSAAQIEHAMPHPRVSYRVAPASDSGLEPASVDLVTVAQALHWLDRPAFYAEVKRVLKPAGVLAVWCYARCHISPEIDREIDWFYETRIGRYWPPERADVERGYRDLPFPFDELPPRVWDMKALLTRDELLGYCSTWSSVVVARRTEGVDPIPEIAARLAPLWPSAATRHSVTWPLTLRLGRWHGSLGP